MTLPFNHNSPVVIIYAKVRVTGLWHICFNDQPFYVEKLQQEDFNSQ